MRTGKLFGMVMAVLALSSIVASSAWAQEPLTLAEARTAMDAAEAEARDNGWGLVFVVTDAEGIPIYLRRMAGATARNYEIAMGKVATALTSGMHTHEYAAAVDAGRIDAIPDAITFEGGLLLRRNGQVIGAMSASGARGSEDAQAVRAGMAAIGLQP
ncbi:MAG: heme-binding protein [Pseudohongiellaceae bacterium]